ncbi:hypothetical protein ACFOD3_22710 [Falsiroseomonas tokyonensis]|uniref:Uncharacterized protein n=1 Tax=Falsiroseomonas tokyonensis TaxID=430521 RepID=A0ABV7C2H1_9PROT|nr:hypothetical protein [Falsiroseomonas tokyonensis]
MLGLKPIRDIRGDLLDATRATDRAALRTAARLLEHVREEQKNVLSLINSITFGVKVDFDRYLSFSQNPTNPYIPYKK